MSEHWDTGKTYAVEDGARGGRVPSIASCGVPLRDTPDTCKATGHKRETVHYSGSIVQVRLVDVAPVGGLLYTPSAGTQA